MQAVTRLFVSKYGVPAIALLGVLLNAPGLNASLFADDFLQWSLLTGRLTTNQPTGSLFGLFNLVQGNEDFVQSMKASGRLLWCASDSLRMSFWRPLAEFSHWLDYQLWPDSPALMHAHNLLWYGALVMVLGWLYRSLDDKPLRAGLSTALYAVSSLHVFAITWLSARNQLMSTCFTALALLCHHAWRQGKGARFGMGALAALMLGLASAEAGVVTLIYMLAYALTLDSHRGWRSRALSLLPAFLIVAAWRVMYQHAGYGALGSGGYIDPGASPLRFGMALLLRLPVLLLTGLTGTSSAIPLHMSFNEQALYALVCGGIVLLLALGMRAYGLWETPLARFYGVGSVLALVPVCAVETHDRVLINAEIGISGLIALLIHRAFIERHRVSKFAKLAKTCAVLMVCIHVVLFPVVSAASSSLTRRMLAPSMYGEALSLPDAAGSPNVRMIVLNPPTPNLLYYYPLVRSHAGMHNPQAIQALATGHVQDLDITVLDDTTLRAVSSKPFQDPLSRDLLTHPFHPGDTTMMGDVQVVIERVDADGAPVQVRFHFPKPLSDAMWRFYAWREEGYQRVEMPRPGQMLRLPSPDVHKLLADRLRRR